MNNITNINRSPQEIDAPSTPSLDQVQNTQESQLPQETRIAHLAEQNFPISNLPGDVLSLVFSFLTQGELRAARTVCLIWKNLGKQVLINQSSNALYAEILSYNHSDPNADYFKFNKDMELLAKKNYHLALRAISELLKSPQNNCDAVIIFSLCAVGKTMESTADAMLKETFQKSGLNHLLAIPPTPPIPLDQTQLIVCHGDNLLNLIFRILAGADAQTLISLAERIPKDQLTASQMPMKLTAFELITSKLIADNQIEEALAVIDKITAEFAYTNSHLIEKACLQLVKNNALDRALALADRYYSPKDNGTNHCIRLEISKTLVAMEQIPRALALVAAHPLNVSYLCVFGTWLVDRGNMPAAIEVTGLINPGQVTDFATQCHYEQLIRTVENFQLPAPVRIQNLLDKLNTLAEQAQQFVSSEVPEVEKEAKKAIVSINLVKEKISSQNTFEFRLLEDEAQEIESDITYLKLLLSIYQIET